jgi:hypothetical protein
MLITDISEKFLEDYNTPGNGFKFLHKSVFEFVFRKNGYFKPLLKCTGRGSSIIMNCYESKKEFLKVLEEIKSGEYFPIDGFKMFYIVSRFIGNNSWFNFMCGDNTKTFEEVNNSFCLFCRNCKNCDCCVNCFDCTNCSSCDNCKQCYECISCKFCVNSDHCSESNKCTDCNYCHLCNNLIGLTFFSNAYQENDELILLDQHEFTFEDF